MRRTPPGRDAPARLRGWTAEARRAFAVAAARERDGPGLWELTAAYLGGPAASAPRAPTEHTVRAYRRGVLDLAHTWPGDLLDPEPDAAIRYAAALAAPPRDASRPARAVAGGGALPAPTRARGRPRARAGLAPASVALRLAAARVLYAALRWAGATEADPVPPSAPRAAASDRRVGPGAARRAATGVRGDAGAAIGARGEEGAAPYGDLAVEAMLGAARDHDDRLIVLLGRDLGLRVGRMLALRWGHVDLVGRRLVVPGDEDGEPRPLTGRAAAALTDAQRSASGGGDAFVLGLRSQNGVYRRLARLCARADLPFRGVDALRRRPRRG